MTRKTLIYTIVLCLSFLVQAENNKRLNTLLLELDKAIANEEQFKEQKERAVSNLKNQLNNYLSDIDDRYNICSKLTDEYEFYRCDSARFYALKRLSIARESGNKDWITDSKIQLASILAKAVMFHEALELMDSIDEKTLSPQQKIEYYRAYYETYVFRIEFFEDGYPDESFAQKRDFYHNAFLHVLPISSYEYASYYGIRYINNNELDKAEQVLYNYLPQATLGTRAYSILTAVLSFLYDQKGDLQKMKEYLALSALSDIKGNVLENASLRTLATLLYEDNDINRANTYVKKSMDDANFYNARIRNFQTSRVLSIIDKAYQTDKAQQQRKLEQLLIIISILSFVLLLGIFFIIREMRKVSRAKKEISEINEQLKVNNQKLKDTNHALAETNLIKEEYVGHFLGLCSAYIEKMEKYQKKIFHKAKTSTADELYKTIRSTQFIEDERTEFYNNFDDSFLKLFPDFVDKFNALLPEEERVVLKSNEKLTTGLRIFALIRLGIDDSTKIAEFLNYSLATIYNYRSRYRNKSLVPRDEFEKEIMKIGSNFM